jgi:hypothetical protein
MESDVEFFTTVGVVIALMVTMPPHGSIVRVVVLIGLDAVIGFVIMYTVATLYFWFINHFRHDH